jgi:hypothetical protein
MKKGVLIFFLIACLPTLLLSQTIVLKNGRRIETQGIWEKDGLVKYLKDGKIAPGIPSEEIERIEREASKGEGSTKAIDNDYYHRTYEFTDHRNAQYKVEIDLLKQAVAESESKYKRFFKVFKRVGNVKYTLPDYREIQRWQSDMLAELYGKMKQLAMRRRMNEREFTILLARFVQHLTYKVPTSYGGFWPPVVCLKEKAGDCDSKSTLFATLFYHFKKNACILVITKRHAFIGIKNQHRVFPTDDVVKIGGIDYLLIEATGLQRLGCISKRERAYLKQGRFKYIHFY